MTLAEYLALDEASNEKHEFMDGYARAMSGGTSTHSLIKVNLISELRTRLRGRNCRPYDSDFRISTPQHASFFYPDASVFCGPIESDSRDKNSGANPTVIFEVLSDSSESFDRGRKFERYRTCDSLRYYVLVSYDKPVVEVYHRTSAQEWLFTAYAGLSASVFFEELDMKLPLAGLYEVVEFIPNHTDPPFHIKEEAAAYAAP